MMTRQMRKVAGKVTMIKAEAHLEQTAPSAASASSVVIEDLRIKHL